MQAILETVDLVRGAGTYRVVSDTGLVLKSGVLVTGNIQDSTTVAQMRTAATNDLQTKKADFKAEWIEALDLDTLTAMRNAWDESVT